MLEGKGGVRGAVRFYKMVKGCHCYDINTHIYSSMKNGIVQYIGQRWISKISHSDVQLDCWSILGIRNFYRVDPAKS